MAGIAQHQPMDKRLRCRTAAAAFTHCNDAGVRAVFQHRVVDQIIDQHHICLAQGAHRFEGQQFRITRTCTHQPDFCVHGVFLIR
ncbi:hypothetical protein D3C81_1993520 [compost metagenome]